MKIASFIEYFRARHGWRCRPGSAVYRDLESFIENQASSPHEFHDLYVLFCVAHGLKPKDPSGLDAAEDNSGDIGEK